MNHTSKKFAVLASVGLIMGGLLTGCKDEPSIPVLGLDESNNEVVLQVPASQIQAPFADLLQNISKETLETIGGTMDQAAKPNSWKPSEVEVGVSLVLQGSITAIVSHRTEAGISLTFSPNSAGNNGAAHE